jgi:hypothetical protein
MTEVRQFLSESAARALPRMLTQISRDPGAPFYGACDRNWWHYKIRDFPSIILQQAGYALSIAAGLPFASGNAAQLFNLAASTARFWNQRAILHGAFEEYYPYEQGYPPVAFSTLAAAKLCHQGIVPLEDIRPGLAIAAKQLLTRFEAEAANQQIAGTAALAVIRTIAPDLVVETAFQEILTRILALQHDEGWFPEYDGPDLGYLAVSIDCLWDIHDHTHDPRILPAIRKAAGYIAWFALSPFGAAGMHNSRNTDYLTPYGLVRLALEESDPKNIATVETLFTRREAEDRNQHPEVGNSQSPTSNLQSPIPFHPFDAVDDRYWCHYIGHSVFRALSLLEAHFLTPDSCHLSPDPSPQPSTSEKPNPPTCSDGHRPPPQAPLPRITAHCSLITSPTGRPGSGHAILTSPTGAAALVSTRKGAITTALWPGGSSANDFGWIVQTSDKLFVSHWWNTAWKVSSNDKQASCDGYLVSHKEHLSAPWKHIVLRIGSFCIGRRLIRILKRLVIFKKPQQIVHITRSVIWDNEALVIRDRITGISENDTITRAPRTSKRHVASADSYHPEDLEMLIGVERNERITRTQGVFECESSYLMADGGE